MSSGEGFTLSGRSLADHPEFAKLTAALQAPQAAVRARLNAVVRRLRARCGRADDANGDHRGACQDSDPRIEASRTTE